MQALSGLIRTMRPRQWTKNILFVFPALIFDGQLFELTPFLRVTFAALLLILASGSVYIMNDLVDIEKDRAHPRKKNRPLPSGQLPVPLAIGTAITLPIITVLIAFAWEPNLAAVLITYLIVQVAYSFYLKNVVILDVLTVTAGFMLRVIAGVVVIDVANFSPWLYACSGLLALFLIVGKRRQEYVQLGEHALNTRPIFKNYNLPLLDDMLRMVMTSTFITYVLYTIETDTVKMLDVNLTLLTVPFVIYGLFYYMYLIHVKGEGGAPDEVLLTDRNLQIDIALWGLTFVFLIYLLPAIINQP
ncbi:decaprenyl-phosphate phosphoribosyltransferase [Phototrophicus methaneseepsis]|uniref:decaprenyl-phosphate phosphoribosyltransferase n=1 Tax=Phototrophicus methaneseepsis TaxID=2710758 RepID=UPI001E468F0E|nr:decaprenyl-phosphate phosphoribosyltransferase [Phototrophicus methaneseepsis]